MCWLSGGYHDIQIKTCTYGSWVTSSQRKLVLVFSTTGLNFCLNALVVCGFRCGAGRPDWSHEPKQLTCWPPLGFPFISHNVRKDVIMSGEESPRMSYSAGIPPGPTKSLAVNVVDNFFAKRKFFNCSVLCKI